MARAMGLRVFGTAGTSEGMALVRQNGAHVVLNHREKGYQEKIMVRKAEMCILFITFLNSNHNKMVKNTSTDVCY